MTTIDPRALTWMALLGKWMDFARASVAVPGDADGLRWQACVPAVINVQAVTFALGEIDQIEVTERALARDLAEILISDAVATLDDAWGDERPGSLTGIIADAEAALEAAAFVGSIELIWQGPGTMVMPEVDLPEESVDPESRGSLAVMMPGTIVMPGEPVAWWTDHTAFEGPRVPRVPVVLGVPGVAGVPGVPGVPGFEERPTDMPRQVYRQLDDEGRMVRDVIVPVIADMPGGMPLLVPLLAQGHAIGHFTMEAAEWLAKQRELMPSNELPVQAMHVVGRNID